MTLLGTENGNDHGSHGFFAHKCQLIHLMLVMMAGWPSSFYRLRLLIQTLGYLEILSWIY